MVLSNDQQYPYDICLVISRGECYSDLALRKPGPVVHSRWLTIAGRILRLYVVTEKLSDNLIILATYIMKISVPSIEEKGSSHCVPNLGSMGLAPDFPLELLQQFLSFSSSMGPGIVMKEDDTITQHTRDLRRMASRNFSKMAQARPLF
ncbi:hypothetical protein AVEN_47268-1 [Araneus ventricosus]|uniref:Uncharacterized protein n=1 Tax=Araneus ventricosus TaxID=182803 RepID=A0A4Y2GQH2_ARAVE|nr:hypothetical protein AVEN_47268-1 [Araneus ventricosus]